MGKRTFDIDEVVRRLRAAVAALPKAMLFELAEEGHDTAFEQLVACILSIRTRDEVSGPAARRLFARARTPAALAALEEAELDRLIGDVSFHERKAGQLLELARRVEADHGGAVPCEEAALLDFRGVGPKCANLVLGIACGEPRVGVDVHVHRVTLRWGYVEASTPEHAVAELESKLPRRYRVELNRLLVPFGKHVCTGRRPRCSTCPVLEYCRQVGVTEHR